METVHRFGELGERLRKFLERDDRAAGYLRDILYYGFAYAADVEREIAFQLSDVDDAMRWGFAHQAGPFLMWDVLGALTAAEAAFDVAVDYCRTRKAFGRPIGEFRKSHFKLAEIKTEPPGRARRSHPRWDQ